MTITFKSLRFEAVDGRIYLVDFGGMRKGANKTGYMPLSAVQLVGGNSETVCQTSFVGGSESKKLNYVSCEIVGDTLRIKEANDKIEVDTEFVAYDGVNAISVVKRIKNVTNGVLKIENAATLLLNGVGGGIDKAEKTYFYKFVQSHHSECQSRRFSLFDYGFFRSYARNFKKLSHANVGSWSTKEELPQGIIENGETGDFLMFQIESNHNWYYEISATDDDFYLALSGNSSPSHRYVRQLNPNETYKTARAAFCYGKDLNDVLEQMTKYRRSIAGRCIADENLPVIFNEYMHLSWDSPSEEKTKKYAPTIAAAGAEYYVIDCGWHDDVDDGVWVYPYMGEWKESKKKFRSGVRKTTDYIRSLGMKAGLWIEPEIVGIKCEKMLDYYDDDCFLKRNGERICVSDKYILNFGKKKVRDYLTSAIRRMAIEYGADYIKMDYNVDSGFVDGDFEKEREAYLAWIDEIRREFPNILFETCSSGGMRMDYETLKHFSIVSTSDQIRDRLYPYIAGNVLSAVLPEQAAVWSYPVSGTEIVPPEKSRTIEISSEKTALNMVNSMLGRTHLSSDLSFLNEERFSLVKEGVEYIKKLNAIKKIATPYFPLGFTDFSEKTVACGLKNGDSIYLAVWVLGGNETAVIPIKGGEKAEVAYPVGLPTKYSLKDEVLTVEFKETDSARFFEIKLKTR